MVSVSEALPRAMSLRSFLLSGSAGAGGGPPRACSARTAASTSSNCERVTTSMLSRRLSGHVQYQYKPSRSFDIYSRVIQTGVGEFTVGSLRTSSSTCELHSTQLLPSLSLLASIITHPCLVWCPGQNKRIAPLSFFRGCRKRRLKD
jgi:hypothetical protein